MSIAFMAIGLPGSGKTTLLAPFAERLGFAYVNRDDIREEIFGDPREQSRNKEVWEEANRRTALALGEGRSVVLDSTFLESWKRRDMIEFLRAAGASQVIGLVADAPHETVLERNRSRDRVVPDEVMERMRATLAAEPPALEEGFDALLPLSKLADLEASF
jgi:predicted kinase